MISSSSTPFAVVTMSLCGLLLLAAGCDRSAATRGAGQGTPARSAAPQSRQTPTTGNGVTIDFMSTPDPPRSGDNSLEVTVKQPDGSPVTDATVRAVFSMPAMPSMSMPAMRSDASLQHVGDGRYRGTGRLSMAGTWNVDVTATRAGEQLGNKRFSVVAR